MNKTLPKAQRTRGWSSAYQGNFFRSCHKFLQSYTNFDQFSSSESRPSNNFKMQTNIDILTKLKFQNLTKPCFRISTKIKVHNLRKRQQQNTYQTSASKSSISKSRPNLKAKKI